MATEDKKIVNDLLSLIHQLENSENSKFSKEQLAQTQQIVQGYFSKPVGATNLGDYHIHTIGSHDATGKTGDVVKTAARIGLKEIAITDHNKVTELQIYLKKLNGRIKEQNEEENIDKTPMFNMNSPIHNINGVNVIPGVEVTCVIPGLKSDKGKPLKVHMLVYGLKLEEPSPLLKMLKAKNENDALVDFGLFKVLEKKYGVSFSEEKIKQYIINRRQHIKGFGRFGADDVIDFLKYNNIKLANNYREIKEVLKSAPGPERMQLNINDVIKLAHASGGICVLAHPGVNLNRISVDATTGQTREEKKAQIVQTLLNYGIDGFECFYNSKSIDKRERNAGERTTTEIIKDEVREFVKSGKNRGNQIVFTAGSDTHFMKGDEFNTEQSLGSTNRGKINLDGLDKFRTEILGLLSARLQGKTTHRNYKVISKEEITQIQQQYTLTAQNYERAYLEGVDNFTYTQFKPGKIAKPTIKHKKSNKKNYPPKIARNFNEFVEEELSLHAETTKQLAMDDELKRIDAINNKGQSK